MDYKDFSYEAKVIVMLEDRGQENIFMFSFLFFFAKHLKIKVDRNQKDVKMKPKLIFGR